VLGFGLLSSGGERRQTRQSQYDNR
jgi:hypothetical protein